MKVQQHCEKKIEVLDEEVEWREFIEEKRRCEEKVKLFDELIKIDGQEWNTMMAILTKQEYENQQKLFKEMEREEQEDWNRALQEIEKMEKIAKLFKEMPNFF